MERIRPAWPERLPDRRNAAPRSKPVPGIRVFAGGYRFDTEATADGASSASQRQRSNPAHLHRGLAAEGRRLVRIAGNAVADLTRTLGDTDSLAGAAQEKGARNICTFIRQSCFFVCN